MFDPKQVLLSGALLMGAFQQEGTTFLPLRTQSDTAGPRKAYPCDRSIN